MKTTSHGPLLPRQAGILASYKQSKIPAPANRGPRQSGAKAGYIFTYKQALGHFNFQLHSLNGIGLLNKGSKCIFLCKIEFVK